MKNKLNEKWNYHICFYILFLSGYEMFYGAVCYSLGGIQSVIIGFMIQSIGVLLIGFIIQSISVLLFLLLIIKLKKEKKK